MAADPLDLVTLAEAADYLDVVPDGSGPTSTELQTLITACSVNIQEAFGPIISRSIIDVDAGTTPTVELADAATGNEKRALVRWIGADVSIGTAADPWASVPVARLERIDLVDGTIRLDVSGWTVAASSALRAGRHLAADVPDTVKQAALVTIRNRWMHEQATISGTLDPFVQAQPWQIPWAARELLAGDYRPTGLGSARFGGY